MLSRIALVCSLALVSSFAFAYGKACHPSSPIGDLKDHWGINVSCKCGDNLANLDIDYPAGLPLTAVCGRGQGASESLGDYFFKGKVLITGKVVAVASDEQSDDAVHFVGDQSAAQSWSSLIGNSVDLTRGGGKLEVFRVPRHSGEKSCWVADAAIRFREVMVRLDDSEMAGSIPVKFEVVRLGKYVRCKAADYNM